MQNDRLIVAAILAVMAAWRLLTWRQHVREAREWLAQRFGPSPHDQEIAECASAVWVLMLAGLAAVVAWA